MHGRSFLSHWRAALVEKEMIQKESIVAKYESLKNQVNPHFLFNNLNALANIVYEDQEKAVKFIKQLADVYRYVLETRDQEVVPLKDELVFLRSYTNLQQIRFGDKLSIDISLPDQESYVAPLALQMLIENAIKHNVISEEDPLSIKVYQEDGYIVVKNNLQRKTVMGEPSSGVGLENIARRYELLSDKKMTAREEPDTFVVKIPVLTNLRNGHSDR
jgi:LytS/YehU family sensor histidine kinase